MQKIKINKGITLIALVITIIILLILAGLAIGALKNFGILEKAKTAKEQYQNAQDYEQTEIAKATNEIDSYVNGGRSSIIPEGYMKIPTKTLNIDSNGEYNVTNYAFVKADVKTSYENEIILLNNIKDDKYNITTNNWEYDTTNGISLNRTDRGDFYFYIPFTVKETGKYLCYMELTQNEQEGKTSPPLYYGISSTPITTYSTTAYNIANLSQPRIVELTKDQTYYLGAVDRITYSYFGYSRVKYNNILICEL